MPTSATYSGSPGAGAGPSWTHLISFSRRALKRGFSSGCGPANALISARTLPFFFARTNIRLGWKSRIAIDQEVSGVTPLLLRSLRAPMMRKGRHLPITPPSVTHKAYRSYPISNRAALPGFVPDPNLYHRPIRGFVVNFQGGLDARRSPESHSLRRYRL